MKRDFRFALILMALAGSLFLPLPVYAQEPVTVRIDEVDFSAFPEVTVLLTIRDARGVPLTGLAAKNFDISEDRTLPSRPIIGVEALPNPDLPISVVLVIDVSGSMKGKPMEDAKDAAIRLLDRLGPQDRAAIIAFADEVNLVEPFPQLDPAREHDFTSDKGPLYQLIEGLEAEGNTPLYDALYKAVRLVAREPAGNRAVLLLTDGRDEVLGGPRGSGSKVADEDTPVREATRARVPVFTIGLGEEVDTPYLKRVAMETGGTFQEAPDSAQLAALFRNVADLLKQQYRITYTSAVNRDGKKHTVMVTVRYGGRTAFDECEWGPLKAAPEEARPKAIPTPQPEVPAEAPTEAMPVSPVEEAVPGEAIPWGLIAALGGGILLLCGAALAVSRRRPREPVYRCLNCGAKLEGPDAPCPHCGYAGQFKG